MGVEPARVDLGHAGQQLGGVTPRSGEEFVEAPRHLFGRVGRFTGSVRRQGAQARS